RSRTRSSAPRSAPSNQTWGPTTRRGATSARRASTRGHDARESRGRSLTGDLLGKGAEFRARVASEHPAVTEARDIEVQGGDLRDARANRGVVFVVETEGRSEPAKHVGGGV